MHTAIGRWRIWSSSAHCDPELAKRIGEKLGKKDWRDTWRRGLAEELGKEGWQGGQGEGGRGEGVLIKFSTPSPGRWGISVLQETCDM